MASTAPGTTMIDPAKSKKYPVFLSDNLLRKDGETLPTYTGIRYNHKPVQSSPSRTTSITPSTTAAGLYNLTLTDDDPGKISTYEYVGGRTSAANNSYALVYDPAKDGFMLDKVDSNFNFNLTSTPWEKSSAKLAEQYPQLSTSDDHQQSGGADDDVFDEEGEPDEDNPYDFRHFLPHRRTSSSGESFNSGQQELVVSRVASPIPTAKEPVRAAIANVDAKSKSKPKSKPKAKPVPRKPAPPPPAEDSDMSGADNESSPEVPIETIEFEDIDADGDVDEEEVHYGGLTIEGDSDDDDTQRRRGLPAKSPLFPPGMSARLAAAPISLSAVSSVSPASHRGSPGQDGLGISFARRAQDSSDSESDADDPSGDERQRGRGMGGPAARTVDSDVDMDGDILTLPSPAVPGSHLPNHGPTSAPAVDEEDDDDGFGSDFEAELEQALESGDMETETEAPTGGVPANVVGNTINNSRRAEEDESESEEE